MAGNFGSDIAFWVDDDISVGGANANGGLGDGYLKFVNIGRFLKLPKDSLSCPGRPVRARSARSARRAWNLSGWDIYDASEHRGDADQNVNNAFATPGRGSGSRIQRRPPVWRLPLLGGGGEPEYRGTLRRLEPNVGRRRGFYSDSNFKDLYARFSYRFNLERDPASRNEIQAAGATGPRDHTYLNLGTLYFYGRSVQRFSGQTARQRC